MKNRNVQVINNLYRNILGDLVYFPFPGWSNGEGSILPRRKVPEFQFIEREKKGMSKGGEVVINSIGM